MAVVGGVRVEGLRELVKALEEAGVSIDDLKEVFAGIARKGADLASSFAPQRTGALAGTVRGDRSKNRATVTAGRAAVRYAGAINYGWPKRNIAGALFMQRADEQLRDQAVEDLERGIAEAIRKAGL